MRTRKPPGTAHDSASSARWAARAASRAPRVVVKTAWSPSPVVFTTVPSWCSTASRRIASWRSSAGRIAAGCCSHSRVEPSRSVNRNVTVPDGSSGTSPPRRFPDARMIARPAPPVRRIRCPALRRHPLSSMSCKKVPLRKPRASRCSPSWSTNAARDEAAVEGDGSRFRASRRGHRADLEPHQADPHRVDGPHDARRGPPRAARRRRPQAAEARSTSVRSRSSRACCRPTSSRS